MKSIFVTGGTGFLGRRVVALLKGNYHVTVLSRQSQAENLDKGLIFVQGDLRSWPEGLQSKKELNQSKGRFDLMLHLAGLYDLRASQEDSYIQNIVSTNHALAWAQKLEIPRFIFSSSVAAAINSPIRRVQPYDLQLQRPFPDFYSEAKALSEQMLLEWSGGPSVKVNLRLGILVGDSQEGEIERIDGPYHAFQAFEKIKFLIDKWPGSLPLPGDETRRIPMVPVDKAAAAVVKFCDWTLQEMTGNGYQSFHLVPAKGLGVREFYKSILRHLLIRPHKLFLTNDIPNELTENLAEILLGFPKEELAYLLNFPHYESSTTKEILGESWCPEYAEYERNLWRGYEKFISNR